MFDTGLRGGEKFFMRAEVEALLYELRQLYREGCESIYLSDETLSELASAVHDYAGQFPASSSETSVPPSAPPTISSKPSSSRSAASSGGFTTAPIPEPPRVELIEGEKMAQWEWLRERVLSDLVCQEHVKPGKKVVFGVGSVDAKIFFCGEAPGAEEEIQAEPFVGPAGQLLTRIIEAMGLTRSDVYIGNIMNWRPEMPTAFGNRPPTQEEMSYCLPFLRAQVAVVKPDVIVALGKTAVDGLLGPDPSRRMGSVRGNWFSFEGIPLIPTFHPSYLLRNSSRQTKRQVWEDMLKVMERVGMPISEKQQKFFQ